LNRSVASSVQDIGIGAARVTAVSLPENSPTVFLEFRGLRDAPHAVDKDARVRIAMPRSIATPTSRVERSSRSARSASYLAPKRLVTFLAGQNNARRLIDDAFVAERCAPRAVIEVESVQAIKDAVRAWLGVAILGEMTLSGRARDAGLLARP
jgi:hypothetical protein